MKSRSRRTTSIKKALEIKEPSLSNNEKKEEEKRRKKRENRPKTRSLADKADAAKWSNQAPEGRLLPSFLSFAAVTLDHSDIITLSSLHPVFYHLLLSKRGGGGRGRWERGGEVGEGGWWERGGGGTEGKGSSQTADYILSECV